MNNSNNNDTLVFPVLEQRAARGEGSGYKDTSKDAALSTLLPQCCLTVSAEAAPVSAESVFPGSYAGDESQSLTKLPWAFLLRNLKYFLQYFKLSGTFKQTAV